MISFTTVAELVPYFSIADLFIVSALVLAVLSVTNNASNLLIFTVSGVTLFVALKMPQLHMNMAGAVLMLTVSAMTLFFVWALDAFMNVLTYVAIFILALLLTIVTSDLINRISIPLMDASAVFMLSLAVSGYIMFWANCKLDIHANHSVPAQSNG